MGIRLLLASFLGLAWIVAPAAHAQSAVGTWVISGEETFSLGGFAERFAFETTVRLNPDRTYELESEGGVFETGAWFQHKNRLRLFNSDFLGLVLEMEAELAEAAGESIHLTPIRGRESLAIDRSGQMKISSRIIYALSPNSFGLKTLSHRIKAVATRSP